MTTTKVPLVYTDSDGVKREVKGCTLTVDHLDRRWIWSEQLEQNIAYKIRGRDDALLAAISSLLFTIKLRDDRISGLQRIADLASAFADQIKPDEVE